MRISGQKFNAIIVILVALAVEIILTISFLNGTVETDSALRSISLVSTVIVLVEIIIWKRLSGELLSPYIVFFITLYIFCCGQSLGWISGANMGIRDLWNRTTYGTNHQILLKGMCYSMIGITSFFLGSVVQTKLDSNKAVQGKFEYKHVTQAYRAIGKLMLIICVPAFLASTVQNVYAVATSGYLAYYSVASGRSTFMSIMSILSDYYQPCLMVLLIGYKDDNNKRKLILAAMLLDVLATLYVGGRSGAFMSILGILVAYHYFIHKFKWKELLIIALLGYLAMAISNGISLNRTNAGRSIIDIFAGIFSATNVVNEFIGELGWNLSSICWTMNLVPSSYPYRYGMSYLVSILTFIPSSFFQNGHPIVKWANLGDWLQASLGQTSGPGYTMIAEAYINFGWYGFVALFIEGIIISKLIASVSRRNIENNMFDATFQIIIIMTIMKSLVRASLSASMRTILFVILPLYLILKNSIKKTTSSIEG